MRIREFLEDSQLFDQAGYHLSALLTQSDQPTLLMLSGGSAAKSYHPLVQRIQSGQANHLVVGMVDERYGPTHHPQSNAQAIEYQTSLWSACNNIGLGYNLPLANLPFEDTVSRYNLWLKQVLARVERMILVLGMGLDGHTASIFPQDKDKFKQLFVANNQLYIGYSSKTEYDLRLTATYSLIKQANEIVVIAVGQDKRAVFNHSLSLKAGLEHKAPINYVQNMPHTTAFISQLTPR